MKMGKPANLEKPDSVYSAGRMEWEERHFNLVQALHTWRWVAVGAITAAVISSSGLVYVSSQHKIVPYLVEFDQYSEPVKIVRADTLNEPTTNQVRAAIRTWLMGVRVVYADPEAQKEILEKSYMMTMPSSTAYGELHEYHSTNNPYTASEKFTVVVAVNSVDKIVGNTWRVEWTETRKSLSGGVESREQWQAAVTTKILAPSTEEQIMKNPAGVFVESFNWSKRL